MGRAKAGHCCVCGKGVRDKIGSKRCARCSRDAYISGSTADERDEVFSRVSAIVADIRSKGGGWIRAKCVAEDIGTSSKMVAAALRKCEGVSKYSRTKATQWRVDAQ